MDLVNHTGFVADWTLGFQRDGRELLVLVVKGTYQLPADGQPPQPARKQVALTKADEFSGEPGLSAPLRETDYAHLKPACDVLLLGSAHVPQQRLSNRVSVALQVGDGPAKSFDVVGERRWHVTALRRWISEPALFQTLPISYDRAYGGTDAAADRPDQVKTYLANPVGRGYHPLTRDLDGKPLPTSEQTGTPATDVKGAYRPMSFGPIGRSWPPRVQYAGTYDKAWLDLQAPFWPDDFDHRHFQAAPPDQQIAYPRGGEQVTLHHLTSQGLVHFRLPDLSMPVLFVPYQGADRRVDAVVDTLLLEPDLQRFTLTWRAILALRKDLFEIDLAVVGTPPPGRSAQQRADGKTWYPGLGALVKARRS